MNMAKTELAALGRQCLDRRIADLEQMTPRATAWKAERNAKSVRANGRFTSTHSRIELRTLCAVSGPWRTTDAPRMHDANGRRCNGYEFRGTFYKYDCAQPEDAS